MRCSTDHMRHEPVTLGGDAAALANTNANAGAVDHPSAHDRVLAVVVRHVEELLVDAKISPERGCCDRTV